jgi:hypothetical protein
MTFRHLLENTMARSTEAVVKVSNTLRTGWLLASQNRDFRVS